MNPVRMREDLEILVARDKMTADDGEIGHMSASFVALAATPANQRRSTNVARDQRHRGDDQRRTDE